MLQWLLEMLVISCSLCKTKVDLGLLYDFSPNMLAIEKEIVFKR